MGGVDGKGARMWGSGRKEISRVFTGAVPRHQVMEGSQGSAQFILARSMAGFHLLSWFSMLVIRSWNCSMQLAPVKASRNISHSFHHFH